MIKVSTTGMVVSLKTDLRFPIPGQQGHGGRIIHFANGCCIWRLLRSVVIKCDTAQITAYIFWKIRFVSEPAYMNALEHEFLIPWDYGIFDFG